MLLYLEPTHLGKLLKPHAEIRELPAIRKFKFSGKTLLFFSFVIFLHLILRQSGVTWFNYIVVLSAVKRAETKLFF